MPKGNGLRHPSHSPGAMLLMFKGMIPHDIQAEKDVLGIIVTMNELGEAKVLTSSDFYSSKNKKIFETILDLQELGEPINFENVAKRVNGVSKDLTEMVTGFVGASTLSYSIKRIKNTYLLRNIYKYTKDISSLIEGSVAPLDGNTIANDLQEYIKTLDFKGETKKEGKLSDDVFEWIQSSTGVFLSAEVFKGLHLSTRQEQKNLSKILNRLREQRVIEKVGHKNGMFRRIDETEDVIDIENASEEVLDIKWPMSLHEYVKIYPQNIIIVAGQSNAGKSAFLIDVAERNYLKHKVKYMSSEMDGTELKQRLFHFPQDMKSKIRWINQSFDWWDKIDPDGINIIDYMEITEEHYKIGGWITQVRNRLNKGIAIIALQKPPGRSEGTGGRVTRDKARLYVAIDFNRIEIVKAKNWWGTARDIDCNGFVADFVIEKGRFVQSGTWIKPVDK